MGPYGAGMLSPNSSSPFVWDRLRDETEEEFNWFRIYYDLGPGRTFRSLSNLVGQEELDLIATSRRFAWDLRLSERLKYQNAVLSQFFQDEQKTKELIMESSLNDSLAREVVAITRQVAQEDADGSNVPTDRRLNRAIKMMALKNAVVKARGERPQTEGHGIVINVLPRDIVEAINQGTHMDAISATASPRRLDYGNDPSPNGE